jgi:periplasmic divalent cation tolerance protein
LIHDSPNGRRLWDNRGQPIRKRAMADTPAPLLVLTSLPDDASARTLAADLVEQRLAACVNILAPCASVYRWQGGIETAAEVPLLIKTTRTRYAELEAAIRALHPYELPEIVAVPVVLGLPGYLGWIAAETAAGA